MPFNRGILIILFSFIALVLLDVNVVLYNLSMFMKKLKLKPVRTPYICKTVYVN